MEVILEKLHLKKGIKNVASTLKKDWGAWLLILPAILCIYFFILRPNVLGMVWSFFDMKGYTPTEFVGLENYRRILTDSVFWKNLWNTCQYVIWSVVLGYGIPIVLAVALNEAVHLRNTFRFWTYFPTIIPMTAISLLWVLLYYPDMGGLLNMVRGWFGLEPYVWLQDSNWTILYIVISMTWSGAGSTAVYYFATLQGVSRELYEAAIIDGAGFVRRFRTVTFPHIRGVALLFLVKQIIGVFSIREQPLIMTDGGPNGASMSLGLQVYKYGFVNGRPQFAMAVSVIMFLILMVLTLYYFKLDKKIEADY